MEKRLIRAKKSLGQNFLISPRVVDAVAKAGDLREGEIVIEIGPGKGVLTRALLATKACVKAIEKDTRLVPVLAKEFEKNLANGTLELFHRDILSVGQEEFSQIAGTNYKVVANIPYYITGALLRNFLSAQDKPKLMVLMVQREVATRIIARDKKESILSLSVKAYATAEIIMNVSKGNFFPVPNVDSVVLKLKDIHNPFIDKIAEEKFFEYVKAGFAQKRKKLISNLSSVSDPDALKEKFQKLNISENARAEDLSLETWLNLSQF